MLVFAIYSVRIQYNSFVRDFVSWETLGAAVTPVWLNFVTIINCRPYGEQWWWVPIAGPFLGAVIGGWTYYLMIELHHPRELSYQRHVEEPVRRQPQPQQQQQQQQQQQRPNGASSDAWWHFIFKKNVVKYRSFWTFFWRRCTLVFLQLKMLGSFRWCTWAVLQQDTSLYPYNTHNYDCTMNIDHLICNSSNGTTCT